MTMTTTAATTMTATETETQRQRQSERERARARDRESKAEGEVNHEVNREAEVNRDGQSEDSEPVARSLFENITTVAKG